MLHFPQNMEDAMSQFLERVAGVLEMPSVTPDLALRSTPGWGSLMGFALIIMLEQEYHVKLTVEEFLKLETVADLANAAGVNA